jgi:hypothetical protein
MLKLREGRDTTRRFAQGVMSSKSMPKSLGEERFSRRVSRRGDDFWSKGRIGDECNESRGRKGLASRWM